MGAIIYAANMQHLRSRQIVFYRSIECVPEFINILSPIYVPLQYPLLFPPGSYGWTPDPSATNPTNLSEIQLYRYWLCREERFLIFGCLTSEYLVDMYSRVEEERLNYICRSHHFQQQARE